MCVHTHTQTHTQTTTNLANPWVLGTGTKCIISKDSYEPWTCVYTAHSTQCRFCLAKDLIKASVVDK